MHDNRSVQPHGDISLRDDTRNIVFKYLGSAAYNSIRAFRLEWGGHVVPVQANVVIDPSDETAIRYVQLNVTGSITLSRYGIQHYSFTSLAEQNEVTLIAAECLLVFGGYYNGLSTTFNYSVELEGRQLTLSDFGY